MSDNEMNLEDEEIPEEGNQRHNATEELTAIFTSTQIINTTAQLQENVQDSFAKLKKIQKKQGGELQLLNILEALNNSSDIITQDAQSLIQYLSNWQVLRRINNEWNDIKKSKLFGLAIHLFDQALSKISKLNCESFFEPIAILFLQEHSILYSFFTQEQYLVGFVDLLNSLALFYQQHKVNNEDQDIDLVQNAFQTSKRGILFGKFINLIENLFKSRKVSSNFDQIFHGFLANIKLIRKPSIKLMGLIQLIHDMIVQSRLKTTLTIIPDVPIIKIRPLTPRIKDEFLSGFKKKRVPDTQDLKKKQKLMKKILVKEIRNDQQYVNQVRADNDQLKKDGNKQAFKKFSRIMDDAQMEYKKLKTTQLNIKRIKKHSKRLGGKHQ